jgi:hypothetical protein
MEDCKMIREIMHNGESMGVIGEDTGYKGYKVGDVVFWKARLTSKANLIVKHRGQYTLMGWCTSKLNSGEFSILGKVISCEKLTDDILKLFDEKFGIRERKEEKEISSAEAFEILKKHYGCEIKIKE